MNQELSQCGEGGGRQTGHRQPTGQGLGPEARARRARQRLCRECTHPSVGSPDASSHRILWLPCCFLSVKASSWASLSRAPVIVTERAQNNTFHPSSCAPSVSRSLCDLVCAENLVFEWVGFTNKHYIPLYPRFWVVISAFERHLLKASFVFCCGRSTVLRREKVSYSSSPQWPQVLRPDGCGSVGLSSLENTA